jgi:hypothetical protein
MRTSRCGSAAHHARRSRDRALHGLGSGADRLDGTPPAHTSPHSHVHTRARARPDTHARVQTPMRAHEHTHMYAQTHMRARTHTYMTTQSHPPAFTRAHTRTGLRRARVGDDVPAGDIRNAFASRAGLGAALVLCARACVCLSVCLSVSLSVCLTLAPSHCLTVSLSVSTLSVRARVFVRLCWRERERQGEGERGKWSEG